MATHHLKLLVDYFPELTDYQLNLFDKAVKLYQDWNSKINVVSRKDIDYILERHFIHSLSIAKYIQFPKGSNILDVGTGGGFPGLPLAIYFPDSKFTLVDSIGKKILVVKSICEELNLDNIDARHIRAEELKGEFDFIVSRAVAPMDTIKHWTKHLLKRGKSSNSNGSYFFLKGGDLKEEIKLSKMKSKVIPLQTYFPSPFFETKKIIHARF